MRKIFALFLMLASMRGYAVEGNVDISNCPAPRKVQSSLDAYWKFCGQAPDALQCRPMSLNELTSGRDPGPLSWEQLTAQEKFELSVSDLAQHIFAFERPLRPLPDELESYEKWMRCLQPLQLSEHRGWLMVLQTKLLAEWAVFSERLLVRAALKEKEVQSNTLYGLASISGLSLLSKKVLKPVWSLMVGRKLEVMLTSANLLPLLSPKLSEEISLLIYNEDRIPPPPTSYLSYSLMQSDEFSYLTDPAVMDKLSEWQLQREGYAEAVGFVAAMLAVDVGMSASGSAAVTGVSSAEAGWLLRISRMAKFVVKGATRLAKASVIAIPVALGVGALAEEGFEYMEDGLLEKRLDKIRSRYANKQIEVSEAISEYALNINGLTKFKINPTELYRAADDSLEFINSGYNGEAMPALSLAQQPRFIQRLLCRVAEEHSYIREADSLNEQFWFQQEKILIGVDVRAKWTGLSRSIEDLNRFLRRRLEGPDGQIDIFRQILESRITSLHAELDYFNGALPLIPQWLDSFDPAAAQFLIAVNSNSNYLNNALSAMNCD